MGRLRWSVVLTQVWIILAILAAGWFDKPVLGVVFGLCAISLAILSHHE